MLRIVITVLASLLTSSAFAGSFGIFQVANNSLGWHQLKIGGGGDITGVSVANDGTILARGDGSGLWLNTGSGFVQVQTATSFPAASIGYGKQAGVYSQAIAPGNSQYLYMLSADGYVYASTNQGASWTKTGRAQDSSADANNGNYRSLGPRMAVDPNDPSFVFAASTSNLSYSTDGGTTWTSILNASVPTTTNNNVSYLICFDTSGGTSGGKTKNVYVASYGHGVYKSTDSGSTWVLAAGSGPTTFVNLHCDASGNVWAVDDVNSNGGFGNVWKLSAGTWSEPLTTSGAFPTAVVTNPSNTNQVWVCDAGGNSTANVGPVVFSINGGGTFTRNTSDTATASDIPWLNNVNGFNEYACAYNPNNGTLIAGMGLGTFTTTPPTSSSAFAWTSDTAAIENLSTRWIVSPLAGVSSSPGYPILIADDFATWTVTNPNQYASSHGVVNDFNVVRGFVGDWAAANPNYIVALVNNPACSSEDSGFSPNGGVSWTKFTSVTPCTTNSTSGGCIAASTSTNFVWLPDDNSTNSNSPWYTTNGGTTWTAVTVSGVATSGTTGWGNSINDYEVRCAADRVTANKFYLFNDGASGLSAAGFYVSANSGASWSLANNGSTCLSGSILFNDQMRTVPGQAGNIFWTHGDTGTYPDSGSNFCWSSNSGATWSLISNAESVVSFGFGAAAAGHTYPTIWFMGWYNSASTFAACQSGPTPQVAGQYSWGLWRSVDWDTTKTFQCIDPGYPGGYFEKIASVEGDNNIYGRVYVGTLGSGWQYGNFNYLLNRDLDPATNDNSPALLNKVG